MEFIAFTYVGNFMEREVIDEVVFTVFDEANRFFHESDIPLRFLYIGKLKLEPGYLINLTTPEGKIRVYPLEALVDVLHARLLREIEKNPELKMNKIFALTTFPLVSRNPYFDFYERFLGIHETRLGLRIMVLSMKPFEPEGLGELLKRTPDEDTKRLVRERLTLFKDRVLKGVLHEIGHGFGLEHCRNDCVMNSPSSMEDWDSRFPGYCDSCFINLKRAVEWSELSLGHGEGGKKF
ncbi:peptidase M54 [Thermococcus siculi]|uniref:Peptidase M54 n=1 Tax=Thermococcus siculi TaxID=72803 RepID=A0A2Z2MRN5_9EURY|nr:peptidase M54 [Thermococcus siculi]ASJ09337.1 peptidase M54 [Thermococcus siculi]